MKEGFLWHLESLLWGKFEQLYHFLVNIEPSPLTKGWVFMGVMWPIIILFVYCGITYTVFPFYRGVCPNKVFETIFVKIVELANYFPSLYLAINVTKHYMDKGKIGFGCYDIDPTDKVAARYVYIFMIAKLVSLLDTFSYAFYTRFEEPKFMHVYHHYSMFLLSWFMAYAFPGGSSLFIVFVNGWALTAVGAVFYLADSCLDFQTRNIQQDARIISQLIQFVLVLAHSLVGISKPCGMPEETFIITTLYIMSLVVLFTSKYKSLLFNCDPYLVIEDD